MPPHYRSFYIVGFGNAYVNPLTGLRFLHFLRWIPYFSGVNIELEIGVKLYKGAPKIDELPYSWRLIRADTNELEQGDDGKLKISDDKQKMFSILYLPRLIGKGKEYYLEIRVAYDTLIVRDWEKVFDFELHSEDKWLFGMLCGVMPVVGVVIWEFIKFIVRWLGL
jgi:hypothetical protein